MIDREGRQEIRKESRSGCKEIDTDPHIIPNRKGLTVLNVHKIVW